MKKPNGTGRFLKKLGLFLLAFFLGIIVAFGSLAGAFYFAADALTLNVLKDKLGIDVGDRFFDDSGTVDVRDLSLVDLFNEIGKLAKNPSEVTLESLIKNYGLLLSEEAKATIPEGIMKMTFEELAADPVSAILNNVTMGNVISISGTSLFGERGDELIKDRPISLLVNGEYSKLLEGIYLGDALADVTIVLDADGNPEAVFENPDEVTGIQEAIALLDLGKLGGGIENDNIAEPLLDSLSTVPLTDLMEGDEDSLLGSAIKDKTLGDVLYSDEDTGEMVFDIEGVINDLYLGTFLGYDPKYDADGVLLYFYKMDGAVEVPASGIDKALVDIKVGDLSSGDVDLMEELDAVYLGEILEYTQGALTEAATEDKPAKYAWADKDEAAVDGIDLTLANLTIGTLTAGSVDMETLGINELPLYEVLGYEQGSDGKWYAGGDTTKDPASSALAAMMQIQVGEIGTELETLYLGELMGYDKVMKVLATGEYLPYQEDAFDPALHELAFMKPNSTGEYDPDHASDPATMPTGVVTYFVTMTIKDLSEDTAINGRVQEIMIGDAMGYTYDKTTGKWLDASRQPATGIIGSLAGTTVGGLDGRVNGLYIGEVIGFDKVMKVIATGEYLPYQEDAFDPALHELAFMKPNAEGNYVDGNEVPTGVMAAFAGMTMQDMEDSSKISAAIQDVKVGDAMGYTYDELSGQWMDAEKNVPSGIIASLADEKVKDLDAAVKTVKVGDAMGYVCVEGVWYVSYTDESTNTPVTDKIILAVIDEEVQNMGDTITTLTVGDVFGDAPGGFVGLIGANYTLTPVNGPNGEAPTDYNIGLAARAEQMFTAPPVFKENGECTDEGGVTIGQMIEAGLLKFDEESTVDGVWNNLVNPQDELDNSVDFPDNFRNCSVQQFVDGLIFALSSVSTQP